MRNTTPFSPNPDPAKASIDKLFAEPFDPLWMKRQREAQTEAELERLAKWQKVIKEYADLRWKLEAERSHQRIMANCRGVWRIC